MNYDPYPLKEDLLGLCTKCFCFRWLAEFDHTDDHGNNHGTCRSCYREANEAAE